MKLLLDKLRPFGFNSRSIRGKEILRLCEHERIQVVEDRIATSYFVTSHGRSRIVIPDHFQGLRRDFALAHEFIHFAHVGGEVHRRLFLGTEDTKEEHEANAIAAIALIPYCQIENPQIRDEYPLSLAAEIELIRRKIVRDLGV
jgi:Zn-dependent peptidase ImmA (M78 family)